MKKRIYALEHIRSIACIFILLFHSVLFIGLNLRGITDLSLNNEKLFKTNNFLISLLLEGHVFVSLFIMISGFILVITTSKNIKYLEFIKKRVLRIYPLYGFLIFLGVFVYPDRFDLIKFFSMLTIFNNINSLNLSPFTDASWTISVLIVCYLLFPFLNRKSNKKLFQIIVLLLLLRGMIFLITGSIQGIAYNTVIGRLDQFIMGMMVANIYKDYISKQDRIKYSNYLNLLVSFFLLFCMTLFYNRVGGMIYDGWWKIFWFDIEGIIWCYITLYYILLCNKKIKLFSYIDKLSYSIYLVHSMCLYIVLKYDFFIKINNKILLSAFLSAIFIVLPLTLILAYFTYNCVERFFEG